LSCVGSAMRLLIVEDDEAFLSGLKPQLSSIGGLSFDIALSRDSAIDRVREDFYDAIVLDLNLPVSDRAGHASVEHGKAVFGEIKEHAPGTPIIMLTGSASDAIHEESLAAKQEIDLWGDGKKVPTVSLVRKLQVLTFLELTTDYARRVAETDMIELIQGGVDLGLGPEDSRILRSLGRRYSARGIRLAPADGGLSASRVLRMDVRTKQGGAGLRAIVKLGDDASVEDEISRGRYLHLLKQGVYAPFLDSLQGGARGHAAALYRLAEGFDQTFFQVLQNSDERAAAIVPRIHEAVGPWLDAAHVRTWTVADVRRQYLDDDVASSLARDFSIGDLEALERRQLSVSLACTHGDLHGGNVLVGSGGQPSLIDFGDVGEACACKDPVTLELCVFSHPAAGPIKERWTPDFSTPWENLAQYVAATPFSGFVRATRGWAREVAFGDHDVNANAYGYCLKQLKYPGTDKAFFVRAVAEMRRYLEKIT
jgi:CheY-like chemotaxis protein